MITVVGLGPGDPTLITAATQRAIDSSTRRFLRTARHPSATAALPATSFDELYERASSLDEVYESIVERLVEAADDGREVLYAVPGSPMVAERSVELLLADPRVDVRVEAAVSFLDLAWARLGIDPLAAGARLVDAHRFAVEAAGQDSPMLVAQCDSQLVLSEIKLAVEDGPQVTVLQRLGCEDEVVGTVQWADLDRDVRPDHLTSLWVPGLAEPVGAELIRFIELVRTLRQLCPWDRRQTHMSLTRHLVEETYEVLEAIEDGDLVHLEEELGDLLFQVVFHATLAAEEGAFGMADVARGIHDKLVRRHPHVFGDGVMGDWESIKKAEKGRSSVMEGVPRTLPSLLYAHKVQRKAAAVGFDWESAAGSWPKVVEEVSELGAALAEAPAGDAAVNDELGDLLFAVVNVARHLDVDPEAALRDATHKFCRRFAAMEQLSGGPPADLAAWDALWDEVKRGIP